MFTVIYFEQKTAARLKNLGMHGLLPKIVDTVRQNFNSPNEIKSLAQRDKIVFLHKNFKFFGTLSNF